MVHKSFREEKVNTEDNSQSGRPSIAINNTSIAIINAVLDENQYVMVRETEAEIGLLQTVIRHILTEHLIKKKVAAL